MSEDDIDNIGADGPVNPVRIDRDRRAPRFSWTPSYETTFFRSLCESVQLGLRENSSFKAEAWERAAQALQATHGAYPAKSHLINKSDNARKRFRLWRGLREDPEFMYDPIMRTVTATEDAWKAHIEKEPLSRALRGRPFDHEDFMEILYPDVIGSGGAPKRIMKPRRRTDGAPADDGEMPGTCVLNLQGSAKSPGDGTTSNGVQQQRPTLSQTPTGSSNGSMGQQQAQVQAPTGAVPLPTVVTPATSSALTPPDETLTGQVQLGRKRRQPDSTGSPPLAGTAPALGGSAAAPSSSAIPSEKRRRTSGQDLLAPSTAVPSVPPTLGGSHMQQTASSAQLPLIEELLEALRTRAAPRWREQALDIFFQEFSEEELDLQVKISENVLSIENKAMVFCKMPRNVRQHWVGKFREMHQLNKTS